MTPRRDDKLIRQIIDRIRELRKARKLTQDAVYEDTNVDVKHIEARGTSVTITTLAILCSYYEITLKDFFDGISLSDELNQWK